MSKTRKIIRTIDDLIDKGLMVLFLIVLFIGLYSVFDSYFVFNAAAQVAIPYYKPTRGNVTDILKELSEDCVAWITIDDTTIDYPVMQGTSNNVYLNKNPYGEYSLSGSIFLDTRNKEDFSDPYNLLYGHHMAGGYMFGSLDYFVEEEYFNEHLTGELLVSDELAYSIEIFAYVEADAGVAVIFNPEDDGDLLKYIKEHATNYREPKNNHILALSTCKSPLTTDRTIVFATLEEEPIEEVKDKEEKKEIEEKK